MILSSTLITWRGVTLSGSRPTDYLITSLAGWDETPDSEQDGGKRPRAHGRFDSQVWSDERVVTVGGRIYTQDRDAVLATLRAAMTISDGAAPESLTITHAGLTLTADARLSRFRPDVEAGYAVGYVPFAIEWRCADPLRYGPLVNATTGFPTQSGGLEFDLFTDGTTNTGYLEFGTAGASGRVTVANPGTADSAPQFQVTGPTPPFTITCVETGARLSFSRALSSGETLLLDAGTGIVTLNGGDVDYSGLLTRAEWPTIPRQSSRTLAFLPDGTTAAGQLTVIMRPAWW